MPDSNGSVGTKGWVPPGGTRWRTAAAVLPETTARALGELRETMPSEGKKVKSTQYRFSRSENALYELDRPARVRILFANAVRQFEFIPNGAKGQSNASALLMFCGKQIVELKHPEMDRLQNDSDGLHSVLRHKSLSKAEIDSILAQADEVYSSFGAVLALHGVADELNVTLLEVILELTYTFVNLFKLHFDAPRPIQLSAYVVPVIPTPSNPSFPGGHAAMAYAAATFFGLYLPKRKAAFEHVSDQIALAREKAGVHFKYDSIAGAKLGLAIGQSLHTAYKAQKDFGVVRKKQAKAAANQKKAGSPKKQVQTPKKNPAKRK